MREKALILGGRLVNRSTLTATSATDGLPVTNLQEYMPEKKYRATSNMVTVYVSMPRFGSCSFR